MFLANVRGILEYYQKEQPRVSSTISRIEGLLKSL